MVDRVISAGRLIAYTLWVLCLGLWVASWAADLQPLGLLALITCGAAVTATVRSYFIEQHEHLKTVLAVRGAVRGDVTPMTPRQP